MSAIAFTLSSRTSPITVADYRERARKALPAMIWAYVDGGAEDELTLRANVDDFDKWALRSRVLTGNEGQGLSAKVGNTALDLPVFLSPTGMTGLIQWTGERAAARAAERVGTRAVISTASSYTVEEIADATSENHFFQLYPWTSVRTGESLAKKFIDRAHHAGYSALFVTVDVPVTGNREGERKRGMGIPPTLSPSRVLDAARKPRWAYNFLKHQRISSRMLVDERGAAAAVRSAQKQVSLLRPELCWDDLAKIRDLWDGPMYVKGILDPDDAAAAVRLGADGIVVSNHGGRQLDSALSSIEALPAVVDRVGGSGGVPVYLDGGIRRGSDVVKALALGATAVGIGRPYVYGLAVGGEDGVAHVLEIFREEIARTLTLMGVRDIAELDRSHIMRRGASFRSRE
ncbi:alpha-hydroxy-acid oxidizing protein [Rhodococcus sp. ACPA4]|uniref:L-lactate dehydrogenase (Cytochrome)/(S)-mandelate dehydrogenase n=1 Tax=Nocardia globerula TaxID=1818 RepID=A0A652YVN6_NOCGL|nr:MULTISPECIES: alpha-hydroxy acid oxidase [Rhodococcus]NMD59844.1 alpha-hydroxy-acid oxidizing protein [Nocardia globerula]PBC42368.1 alpha-hydroxy-acid oxidizing protein [Rhodococcus sp. ACPA4]PVX64058.1 L-lactate dehydrogenase (cytochrome)/(S)-mandelate dehydrogenase [Rhodococcus globerulus]ROZ49655.1 alpha-hydroxy-acid oxidizing protein [Rhodococcus sp. WS3]